MHYSFYLRITFLEIYPRINVLNELKTALLRYNTEWTVKFYGLSQKSYVEKVLSGSNGLTMRYINICTDLFLQHMPGKRSVRAIAVLIWRRRIGRRNGRPSIIRRFSRFDGRRHRRRRRRGCSAAASPSPVCRAAPVSWTADWRLHRARPETRNDSSTTSIPHRHVNEVTNSKKKNK